MSDMHSFFSVGSFGGDPSSLHADLAKIRPLKGAVAAVDARVGNGGHVFAREVLVNSTRRAFATCIAFVGVVGSGRDHTTKGGRQGWESEDLRKELHLLQVEAGFGGWGA